MKKKKNGLIKRIAAGVCAVVMAASCAVGSVPYYADVSSCDYFSPYFKKFLCNDSVQSLPGNFSNYNSFLLFRSSSGGLYCYLYNNDIFLECLDDTYEDLCENSSFLDGKAGVSYKIDDSYVGAAFFSSNNGVTWSSTSTSRIIDFGYLNVNFDIIGDGYRLIGSSSDIFCSHNKILMSANMTSDGKFIPTEIYNSSLGYLQNIKCKELYLEDADYAYDPNYLKKVWTFADTSTTGLNITDGTYSVRHYQQITVRNTNITNPIVKEYDMILMNEFPADSLRYEYMSKDYTTVLQTQSGFEPLGFWETSVLGQFLHTRDYFQLVRTNSDGSVEYGGYVKIDLKGSPGQNDLNAESESTTITPEGVTDTDGYVGGNMDYTQGSGSDYGQAENDADENASNSSTANKEFAEQMNDMVSMVSAVPQLFAALFSFLPEWCLNLLAAGVGFGVILLIWKAARG